MGLGKEKDESPLDYQIRICEGKDDYNLSWDEVAQILNDEFNENFGESKYRKWWYAFSGGMNYVQALNDEKENVINQYLGSQKKDFQILKTGEQASSILCRLSNEQLKDPDYILKIHGYDSNLWQLTSARQSIWNSNVDKELYSSKITVKPRDGFNWNRENVLNIFKNLKNINTNKIDFPSNIGNNQSKMVLIAISDLHFGLLAKENLSEEYNMKIAQARFDEIIKNVILKEGKTNDVEKVVLLVGNDFLNADNLQGTTSRHFTQQDQETNWYEMVTKATEMLINGINQLRLNFPNIEVINVKGNHDEMSMFGIMQTLNAYYKDVPTIEINTNSKFRQYIKYGVNLIGLSHNEKVQNVSKIMAAEASGDWSNAMYKCFLMGHLHSRKQFEDDYGVDVYNLPSVVGASAWTSSQGYVGTNKMSQSFIFDKNNGLIEILNHIVK